jgi:hypothetical protein
MQTEFGLDEFQFTRFDQFAIRNLNRVQWLVQFVAREIQELLQFGKVGVYIEARYPFSSISETYKCAAGECRPSQKKTLSTISAHCCRPV